MKPNSPVRLTFLGAAGTVTGSKYLVECESTKVLVDCGIFQGRKELRERNWAAPNFNPTEISAVVLTHAHIDHTGYLPLITRLGYRGPVYCTEATRDLLNILLLDSAHLQEEEAKFAKKHGTSKHAQPKPLYTQDDAAESLRLLKTIPRGRAHQIAPGFQVTASCAGHILGATSLNLDVNGRRITFSGDVGRYNAPILPDPQPLAIGDLLLCESTYGNREHSKADTKKLLADVVKRSIDRKGPLIIPAFALGRTQDLLYDLAELERKGEIPVLPIYIDSPMAMDATNIYRRYKLDYDEEAQAILKLGETPLATERTIFCRTVEESKRLNFLVGPRIIISASGMVNGGRVLHHMKRWLPEESTTVLFVGYQAEETRGRTILSGADSVKIFGEYIPIRAQIEEISSLSAHADKGELLRWLKSCNGTPKQVKIVHGEPDASRHFAETLKHELYWSAEPAKHLETIEV